MSLNVQKVLVTGCYRSGTTLLEKMLHAHPGISIASQPFAAFFFLAKERFFASRGIVRLYPVDPMFPESEWAIGDLQAFLARHVFTQADIDEVFERLRSDALGLWTPEILDAKDSIRPGVFRDVLDDLYAVIARIFPKPEMAVVGSKEILMEEFVPTFVGDGRKCVIIIRDPRDMITSLNFNRKDNATGAKRPILYSLRMWRKSVALALQYRGTPAVHALRYEDLVNQPMQQINEVNAFLGMQPLTGDDLAGGISDQRGEKWSGNSSFSGFSGVSKSSVGAYVDRMPMNVQHYIETVCRPEMEVLGYELLPNTTSFQEIIRNYQDGFEGMHHRFASDYSADPTHVDEEIRRLKMLSDTQGMGSDEAAAWFHAVDVYNELRK